VVLTKVVDLDADSFVAVISDMKDKSVVVV
jgi:hypothetical protein